jgi:hypothetical protein
MTLRGTCFLALLALIATSPAFADDHEKAQKEIKKISSIAVDSNCRSVANREEAEMFKVSRADLVKERQDMNLDYGSLFLAQELVKGGANVADIGSKLKAGTSIWDIASSQNANWKEIASDSKKLNKKIDDGMVKRFKNEKADVARDSADAYDAKTDRVAADSSVSKEDVADAQKRYQHLHEMSAQNNVGVDAASKSLGGMPAPSSK